MLEGATTSGRLLYGEKKSGTNSKDTMSSFLPFFLNRLSGFFAAGNSFNTVW